jgi:2'-5' RNA ligase
MIRSFIALELEDEDTKKNIQSFGERLKANQSKIKLVEPENLHMTVKFLGDIEESAAPKIYSILKENVNLKLFQGKIYEYKLRGAGQFKNYSTLWINLEGEIEFLQNVKDYVEELLYNKMKIPKDKRLKFIPHLTIGRLKSNKINYKNFEVFKKLIAENKNTEFGQFLIKEIKLKKSVLTPKGPIYSDLIFE